MFRQNVMLLLVISGVTGFIAANTAVLYNNTASPILIWPIPKENPPYLLAKIPHKEPGVQNTPARLEWPGDTQAIVVFTEEQVPLFQETFQEATTEYIMNQKPHNFDWEKRIRTALEQKRVPREQWAIFYPEGSRKDLPILLEKEKDYKLVIYHAPTKGNKVGQLTGISAPSNWHLPIENYGLNNLK